MRVAVNSPTTQPCYWPCYFSVEQATYDSVAFRFITDDRHPDHDTIAHFRKRFLVELEELFLQILVARAMGVFKLGTVSFDGERSVSLSNLWNLVCMAWNLKRMYALRG